MKKFIALMLTFAFLLSSIHASKFIGHSDFDEQLTTFDYARKGAGLGIGLGVACGYLEYLKYDKDEKRLLKTPIYGFLIGALAGVTLAIYDSTRQNPGVPDIILKDMQSTAALGCGIGLCVGLIKMIDTEKGTDLFNAAAWGTLSGAAVGLILGIIEGPKAVNEFAGLFKVLSKIQLALNKDTLYLTYSL